MVLIGDYLTLSLLLHAYIYHVVLKRFAGR